MCTFIHTLTKAYILRHRFFFFFSVSLTVKNLFCLIFCVCCNAEMLSLFCSFRNLTPQLSFFFHEPHIYRVENLTLSCWIKIKFKLCSENQIGSILWPLSKLHTNYLGFIWGSMITEKNPTIMDVHLLNCNQRQWRVCSICVRCVGKWDLLDSND